MKEVKLAQHFTKGEPFHIVDHKDTVYFYLIGVAPASFETQKLYAKMPRAQVEKLHAQLGDLLSGTPS